MEPFFSGDLPFCGRSGDWWLLRTRSDVYRRDGTTRVARQTRRLIPDRYCGGCSSGVCVQCMHQPGAFWSYGMALATRRASRPGTVVPDLAVRYTAESTLA